uniref:hypothetical protein n=1 Tax=Methylophaga sp. TaxID=2024840 RepID=UPI003A8F7AA5
WVQLLQVQEPLLAKQIFLERYKVGLKNETQRYDIFYEISSVGGLELALQKYSTFHFKRCRWGVHLFCLPKINEPNKRAPEIAFDPKIKLG